MHWVYLLLFSSLSVSSLAQFSTWDFRSYHQTNGAPTNHINWVTEDSFGFIWLASDIGLFRFDGTTYSPIVLTENSGRVFEGSISELFFDKEGFLWIGTDKDGLFRYYPKTGEVRHYLPDHNDDFSLPSSRVYNFFADNKNQIWFCTHGTGLCRYDEANDRFVRIRPFKNEAELKKYKDFQHMISNTTRDNRDSTKFWMASLHGLVLWESTSDTYQYLNPPTGIVGFRSIIQDDYGLIWGTTWGRGMWKFNPVDYTWTELRCDSGPDDVYSCLNATHSLSIGDSTLMIATQSGLMLFNTHTMSFDTSLFFRSPRSPYRFFTDSKQNLWITAPGEGLFMHLSGSHDFLRTYFPFRIQHITADRVDGSIWASSDDTLYHISSDGVLLSGIAPDDFLDPDEHFIIDHVFDVDGRLWVMDYFGPYLYESSGHLKPFDHPGKQLLIQKGYYWRFFIVNNVCWMLSQSSGVLSLNLLTKEITIYDYEEGNPHSLVHNYSIGSGMVDRDGDIWGSSSSGIFYYDQSEGHFKNADVPLLFKDDTRVGAVNAFAQDSTGLIWIAMNLNLLGKFSKGELSGQLVDRVEIFSKLPSSRITDMLFDHQGDLWLAAADGIARYKVRNTEVELFGNSYGIHHVTDLELHPDGRILAAVDGKILAIDPHRTPIESSAPRPVITSFRVFDQEYQNEALAKAPDITQVELSYSQNFFSFEFGVIDFSLQQAKEYAYMLEGVDKDWNYPPKGRQYAAYTNIGGGEFVFRVKARNPGEGWSREEAHLKISITPPFWQRPVVIFGIALLFGFLIFGLYRYRIREIKKKEALMTAFNKQLSETEMKALRAQMNPHFLFNTLNAIKLYVQKNDQEKAVGYLTDFAKLIRQVLQNSANSLIPLSSELEALDLYIRIERMRFDASFEYHIEVGDDVSPDMVRIPPLLLQPYVENAIWHGLMHKSNGPGLLEITVVREGRDILCTIEDNGIGREAAAHVKSKSAERNKSMGMQITKDRMDITGQMSDMTFDVKILDVSDDHGRPNGTKVILRISKK